MISRVLLGILIAASLLPAATGAAAEPAASAAPVRVLLFSSTGGYRHEEIPAINHWAVRLGLEHDIHVDVTETGSDLTPERLATYDVLFLQNSNSLDKVLDEEQREAVKSWFQAGGGIVGTHAAAVRQEGWPWFLELVGCDFGSDSDFVRAKVVVDPGALDHPAVTGHGPEFLYTADWHNHTRPVTGLPGVQVLMRLDETSFEPVRDYFKARGREPMGEDHPAAWTREYQGGRFFYTEIGHDVRSLDTPFGRQQIVAAIRWAARR